VRRCRRLVQTSLTIANGRGNQDIFGSSAEYRLWLVGDPNQPITYDIAITWFDGAGCCIPGPGVPPAACEVRAVS
jgi:hypothetical protein